MSQNWLEQTQRQIKLIEKMLESSKKEDREPVRLTMWWIQHMHTFADALPWHFDQPKDPTQMLNFVQHIFHHWKQGELCFIDDPIRKRTWMEWMGPHQRLDWNRVYRARTGQNPNAMVKAHDDIERFMDNITRYNEQRTGQKMPNLSEQKSSRINTHAADTTPGQLDPLGPPSMIMRYARNQTSL